MRIRSTADFTIVEPNRLSEKPTQVGVRSAELKTKPRRRGRWREQVKLAALVLGIFGLLIPAAPTAAQADIYYRFAPTAIYNDGQDSTTLEIYTGANDVANVTIKPEFGDEPVYQLYDDGTNGDRSAGDGVYTLGGITTDMFPEDVIFVMQWDANGQNADLSTVWLSAEIAYTSGQSEYISFIELKIISSRLVFPAEQVGNGLYATEYAFFIVDPVGETYTGSFPNITDYNGPAIAKKFYTIYPDEFDFINFMVVRGDLGMKAHSGGLRTPADNIGLDRVDYTAEYGSQGRLMTMTYSSFGFLNHEIGHTWGAFLGVEQGISTGVHWAGNTDIAGMMSEGYETQDGLYFFTPNGDGTFKAGWFEDRFAPLELYLMGLISPEEVPDVQILHDPDLTNMERVTATSIETYTIEEIMASAGGPRQPSYPAAQTDFNMAIILLSDSGFSPAEIAFYTFLSKEYSAHREANAVVNFYTATGGRGTVNTRLADWGIPNIQASIPTSLPTLPPQPTYTSIPSPIPASEQVQEEVPQPTSGRPEFNFPVCTGALVFPLLGSAVYLSSFRRNKNDARN